MVSNCITLLNTIVTEHVSPILIQGKSFFPSVDLGPESLADYTGVLANEILYYVFTITKPCIQETYYNPSSCYDRNIYRSI